MSDLELFTKVVERASLTAAGTEMGLSPASASKRLSRLEAALGARLISRTTRHVRPTEDGESFYQRAKQILSDVKDAEIAVSRATQEPRGFMRVSMPAGFGRAHIGPLLVAFMKKHPEVRIEVIMSDRLQDLVSEGIDVSIRVAELKDSSLVARKLASNRRVLCATPSYVAAHGMPRTPKDLADHKCLTLTGQDTWRLVGKAGSQVVRVSGPLTTNNTDVLRQGLMGGLGIVMKSLWDVGPCIREGQLIQLLPEFEVNPGVGIYAVYPSARHLTARSRALLDFLVEAFCPVPPWEIA